MTLAVKDDRSLAFWVVHQYQKYIKLGCIPIARLAAAQAAIKQK